MAEGTLSHPRTIDVLVLDGTRSVSVRKWKMRERAELRPRILELFQKISALEGTTIDFGLASVFLHAEEECAEIARLTSTTPDGLEWDDLDWEDLPDIVQAVWSLNIVTPTGGGLLGKAGGLLAELSSPKTTESKLSGPDSASSPEAGGPPLNA